MLAPEEGEWDELTEILEDEGPLFTTIQYLAIFVFPALFSFVVLYQFTQLDVLFSAIIALAVMNGSINSMIAWLTIRLDDKSGRALKHLTIINNEMERLEDTLDDANLMVSSFTGDLEEAKAMFTKVGVDLGGIDLEPVAEVVEKLKENREGFNEVLDNMKDVDMTYYIQKAKGIDWDALLNAAEDVMSYIKGKSPTVPDMTAFKPTLESIEPTPLTELDLPAMAVDEGTLAGLEEAEDTIIIPPPRLSVSRKRPNLTLRR